MRSLRPLVAVGAAILIGLMLPALASAVVSMSPNTGSPTQYVIGSPAVALAPGMLVIAYGPGDIVEDIQTVDVTFPFGSEGGDAIAGSFAPVVCSTGDRIEATSFSSVVLFLSVVDGDDGVLEGCGSTEWESALRQVTFSSTSQVTGQRDVRFHAKDINNVSLAQADVQVDVQAPPQVGLPTASRTVAENAPATAILFDATVTSASGTVTGATVGITANFVSGEDVLAFANDGSTMGNIIGSFNAGTGVLTLTSSGASATPAQWQNAVRAVTYQNASEAPSTAQRTVRVTAFDGSASGSASMTLGITAINDAPQLAAGGGSPTFVEGGAAVVVDPGILVADPDHLTLASATVSISSNFAAGEDVLAFTNDGATMGNIAVSGFSSGVLSLTSAGATATEAQWRAALRSVTYANTSASPSTATRSVAFRVSDGVTPSNIVTTAVAVQSTNSAPVVTTSGGSATFTEGEGPVAVDGAVTVTDADHATLASATVSITGNFASGEDVLAFSNTSALAYGNIAASYSAGTLTLTSAGATATREQWQAALRAVTYNDTSVTPSTATRTVSFVVNDGTSNSSAATRNILVTAVNNPPQVITTIGATSFTEDGGPVVVDSGVTVEDVDGLIVSATVRISSGFVQGQDVLALPSQGGTITGSYNASTGVLTITDSAVSSRALWENALRAVTYDNTSQAPDTRQRTVSFTASDGTDDSAPGLKLVGVTAVADTPVVTMTGSTLTALEGVATPVDSGIAVSDADGTGITTAQVSVSAGYAAGQDLLGFAANGATMGNITGSFDGSTGVLTLSSAGGTATDAQWQVALRAVTYINTSNTPNTGARTLKVRVRDGDARPWVTATRALAVTAVNDAPSWSAITIAIPMEQTYVFGSGVGGNLGFLYSDPEDDVIGDVRINSIGAFGTLEDCNGAAVNVPATVSGANFMGTGPCPLQLALPTGPGEVTLGIEVSDAVGAWSGASQITFDAVAPPPSVAVAGSPLTVLAGGVVVVGADLTLGPTQATGLSEGAVTITSGLAAGDELTMRPDSMGGIINIEPGNQALDLVSPFSPYDSPAQWQQALRTVTLRAGATPGTRVITFRVGNGLANETGTVTVQVLPAPVVDTPTPDAPGATPAAPATPSTGSGATPARAPLTPAARARAAYSTAVSRAAATRAAALRACARRPAAVRGSCRTAAARAYTRTVALAKATRTRDLALARCTAKKGKAKATCQKTARARYARDRARATRR